MTRNDSKYTAYVPVIIILDLLVPGNDGSDNTECTTSDQSGFTVVEFGSGQEDKGDEETEEHACKAHGRSMTSNQKNGGHNSPREKINAERLIQHLCVRTITFQHTKSGHEDSSIRQPEATITGECSGTKSVTSLIQIANES